MNILDLFECREHDFNGKQKKLLLKRTFDRNLSMGYIPNTKHLSKVKFNE